MACFPMLRSIACGFVGGFIAACIALPLATNGIISDDAAVGTVAFAYTVVGLGWLLICETPKK